MCRATVRRTRLNEGSVIDIAVQSILLATKLAAPILGVSLAIGLFVGLIQSATQIQEQTLTFVPKLAGVALVIVITGHWMLVADHRLHAQPVRDDPAPAPVVTPAVAATP